MALPQLSSFRFIGVFRTLAYLLQNITIVIMALSKYLDPKNGLAFKRIFGSEKNKDILVHFINDVLGLEGKDRIQEVSFQPTIQDPVINSKKQSILDVLCKDEKGEYIIVEMQVAPQEGFEKRAQYYAAKAYSRQLDKGKEEGCRYKDLKAVIYIAVCDNVVFKDKKPYLSRHIILDKVSYSQDLKDFSFTFIELAKFDIKEGEIDKLSNIVEKWCYFFKYAPFTKEEDVSKIVGEDGILQKAYEALNQYNWSENELLLYEQEVKRVMDNLAAEEYIFNQGIQQGEEKGSFTKAIEIAKGMLQDKEPIEKIIKWTGLTKAEIDKILQRSS